MADYQANLGAASRPEGPEPFLPFSNAVIKMAAREDLQYNWSDKWQHKEKGCRQTRIFFPEPIMALSKSILSLNRRILGMLIMHFTGFSHLNYHQSNIDPGSVDPTCRLCGQGREESQHIIRTCLALADIRLAQLWQLEITDASWFLNGIIGFLESPRVRRLENDSYTDTPQVRPAPAAGPPRRSRTAPRLPPTTPNSPHRRIPFSQTTTPQRPVNRRNSHL